MPDPLPFPMLMTEKTVAAKLGVSVDTLRRARKSRKIAYVMIGGRPKYRAEHVSAYLAAMEVPACQPMKNQDASGITGSPAGLTVPSGAEPGSTPTPDRRAAHRSALTILTPPRSRLPDGSR